tara:strand:- start:157 stop:438 length:282 start_codon:yes stop_codon:yes gene_type:complete
MRSTTKKVFVLVNFFFLGGLLNIEYLADTKNKSIINLFCLENFKQRTINANKNYDDEIAKYTCDCYLKEFLNSSSHQKAINKCKLETKKKFNL